MHDFTTTFGFTIIYFQLLPHFKTKEETFKYLNEFVEYATGVKPYKSYDHFRSFVYKKK
jgi:hypothetical protein